MKVLKALWILVILGFIQVSPVNSQVAGVCENAVAYNTKSGNCIWLSNLTAKEIKEQYENRTDYKPENIVPVNDKTSEGYRMFYKHQGKRGWQKYCITVTSIRTNDCISYYKESNPDLLMVPFRGIKELVGKFGHSSADFKKIYRQYEHLACRIYRQIPDNRGVLSDEMTVLLTKYIDSLAINEENLMASGEKGVVAPVANAPGERDTWEYWTQFLKELDTKGYVTLIEYSTCPLDN